MKPKTSNYDKGSADLRERDVRITMDVSCTMILSGALEQEQVVLENIGRRGFSVRCASTPFVGSSVALVLPDLGRVTATIRWAFCGRAGGVFTNGLEPDVLNDAIAAWSARENGRFDF